MPGDINSEEEKKHLAQLKRVERQIRKAYEDAIHEIVTVLNPISFNNVLFKDAVFKLKDYPALQKRINREIKKLHASIYAATVNSIETSWDLSNQKNNLLVDRRLAGATASARAKQVLYDPNKGALDRFLGRKEKGLSLSDRVWKTMDGYRTEMEAVLGVGVSEGKSADEIANGLKRFLNEPDRLFRRIRGDDGKLKLSKEARDYHPGRGVYRSSFQNAKRLARTETNMAYRSADFERWQQLPFVIGIEVGLSAQHPVYDICDELAGQYPKDFLFVGWHPNCLCFAKPVQMDDEEYDKYEDAILAGTELDYKPKKIISKPPASFTKYLEKNSERISKWANEPYWLKDNKKYVQ